MREEYKPPITLERGNKLVPDFEPAFPSLPQEKAAFFENFIKAEYEITDYIDPRNPSGYRGWLITDKRTGKQIVFSPNSRAITTKEYLRKKGDEPIEDVLDLCSRVAVNIATAEMKYGATEEQMIDTARRFAKRMIYQEFAPNTPTFANAGGHLQQLAACFGLVMEDYLATDDIGEDPEKQGDGIMDMIRYGAMIQKSGGGTGYNFSYTRPKNSGISTTTGRASGPVSWLKSANGVTQEINQGGFRRGANMGILEYWHPDIFEFISAKANHKISFFNLSIGTDEKFWEAFDNDGYYQLVSPKDRRTIPLEQRVLTRDNLITKERFEKLTDTEKEDWDPSLLIDDDGKTVIVRYTGKKVGFIDEKGVVNISAKATLEYAAEVACKTGCPGIISFDRMNRDNPTPHVGVINVVNPCGEQPLLNFESCNLGSVNLYSCIEDVPAEELGTHKELATEGNYFYGKILGQNDKRFQRRLNMQKFGEIIDDGVHFLDNVIDMCKYPFKKVYAQVKSNRKIGLGLMGVADATAILGIAQESETMERFAEFITGYMYRRAFTKSQELAEKRGVFPNWKGSVYDPESPHAKKEKVGRIRNATLLTIAPNGTTGQYAGVNGGIEPFFGVYWTKNLQKGGKLLYWNKVFLEELELRGLYSDELVERIKKEGTIQNIEEIPQDMKERYKLSTEVDPIWHVRIQGAFQKNIDNAVSKTVNLPKTAKPNDFYRIFVEARKRGCKGITAYRDGTIEGQPLTIDVVKEQPATKPKDLGEIVRINVPIDSPAITLADNASKYRIERGEDTFHVIWVDEMRKDPKTGKVYLFPREDFQQSAPLGDETSVEFASAGLDRTNILKEDNPDYVKLIKRWKSVTGNRSAGLGPGRINSPTHAVGLVFEHALLTRGIVKYDENGEIIQLIKKKDTIPLTEEEKDYLLNSGKEKIEQRVVDKEVAGFLCGDCGSTEYIFEQGCHEPKCKRCGWTKRGGCS